MSKLKFFTDAHIAMAIVEQLRRRGIEVLRCEDAGMKHSSDDALLAYATENGYALLSMDVDVTRLDKEWKVAGKRHGGIFYGLMARLQGEAGIGAIVRYCADYAELIENGVGTVEDDVQNRVFRIKE